MKRIKIGKRNIKTAISVFLSVALYLVLVIIDRAIGKPGDGYSGFSGFYTPFFAGIAAAYASHRDRQTSIKQAKIRSIGSIIGGYFGMVVILIVELIFKNTEIYNNDILYKLISFSIISIAILPLIFITVFTNQKDATFLSCLTYLSVTISIRNGGMNIPQFATNRILSTLIGVGIAILVNNFRLHYKKNQDILFLTNIDSIKLKDNYSLNYMNYKINDLYNTDMNLALYTNCGVINHDLFYDVNFQKPLILLDGLAIYDYDKRKYLYSYDFTENDKKSLNKFLKDFSTFTYVVHDYHLLCYYKSLMNPESAEFYNQEHIQGDYTFVYGDVLDECDVLMYKVIVPNEDCEEFVKNIQLITKNIVIKTSVNDKTTVVKIIPNDPDNNIIQHLPYYEKTNKIIAFINDDSDLNLDEFCFTVCYGSSHLRKKCDYVVESNNFNDVLNLFDRIYRCNNLEKYLQKLRRKSEKNGEN